MWYATCDYTIDVCVTKYENKDASDGDLQEFRSEENLTSTILYESDSWSRGGNMWRKKSLIAD